jgi:branched-chain amino acid transport system permease protein
MEPVLFAQAVANSIMLGLIYTLIALGITLIFSIMKIVNFAHGQIYMLGAFAIFYFYAKWHINYFFSLVLAALCIAALGALLEHFLFRRLRGQELPCLLLSLGLALLFEGLALIVFGEKDMGVPPPFPGAVNIYGVHFGMDRLLIIFLSLFLLLALFIFIQKFKSGRAIRALAQDPEAATLQGVDINRMSWFGFSIGCMLAGLSGGLLVPVYWVSPFIGGPTVVKAFIVMVLGGLGSIPGTVLGGLILGSIESFGQQFLPGTWAMAIAYILVVLMILIRPRGLMGKE